MTTPLEEIISKHFNRGIVVDSNLLLLFFLVLFDSSLIPRFKRTQKFEEQDGRTLGSFLAKFKQIWSTPTILCEVSNLANQLSEPGRSQYFRLFSARISLLEERFRPSKELAAIASFPSLGLADCSLMEAASSGFLVLTDDFRLAQSLSHSGFNGINFNHIRSMMLGVL